MPLPETPFDCLLADGHEPELLPRRISEFLPEDLVPVDDLKIGNLWAQAADESLRHLLPDGEWHREVSFLPCTRISTGERVLVGLLIREHQPGRVLINHTGTFPQTETAGDGKRGGLGSQLLVIAVVALVPIGIAWFHWKVISDYREQERWESEGIEISAVVVKKESTTTPRSPASFHLVLDYEFDGQRYTEKREVDQNTHLLSSEGGSLKVRIDPEQPDTPYFAGDDQAWISLVLLIAADALLLTVIGVGCFKCLRRKEPA